MNSQIHESIPYSSKISSFFRESIDGTSFVAEHWHRGLELIYLKQGGLEVTVNALSCKLTQDDFIIISPGDVHSVYCPHSNHAYVLQISYDFLSSFIPDMESLHFENIPFSCLTGKTYDPLPSSLLIRMHQIQKETAPYSNLLFYQQLFEMVYHLISQYSVKINPALSVKTSRERDRLVPILTYIQSNYNRPLSLTNVASQASLSPEYFCRYFKKYVGISLTDYMDNIRLQQVVKDFMQTDLPICTLLEQHGFRNPKHFRQLFLKTFKTTPAEFRNNSIGKK